MSSPIAKQHKSSVDNALIATHQYLSHGRRINVLARTLSDVIVQIMADRPGQSASILDVGCGDMTLADAIAQQVTGANLSCVDIHPVPTELARIDPRWQRYSTFDGKHLPFADETFDVVMFSDVLHHVPDELRTPLLASAARVGRIVLVKDHFETGWWSRQTLRAMDWVGNFGYGVSVPTRYFDRQSFTKLCSNAGLTIDHLDIGVRLYEHLPLLRSLLSPDWQFVAVCRPHSSDISTLEKTTGNRG